MVVATQCSHSIQENCAGRRCLSEDEFCALLRANAPRVRSYARSLSRDTSNADDLLQEALLRAWSSRHQFQPGTNFRAWLCTILRNYFLDQCRARHLAGATVYAELGSEAEVAVGPEQDSVLGLADVARAYERLPARAQKIIMMAGAMGLSYEETADALGCPLGTVRSRLSRARAELRSALASGRRSPSPTRRTRAQSSLHKLIA